MRVGNTRDFPSDRFFFLGRGHQLSLFFNLLARVANLYKRFAKLEKITSFVPNTDKMKKSELQHRRTDELVPYAGNARTHSEVQVNQICESIQKFGFYNPVLIDETGLLIAGHGRIMAAKQLGLETVPTMVIYDLTEAERRALTLADNKISLNSSWDMDKVREELSALVDLDMDLELTGFQNYEIEALLRDDLDILPADTTTSFFESVPQAPRSVDESDEVEDDDDGPGDYNPKVTDNDYSRFDLVMIHKNKTELIDVLNEIKTEHHFETLEDALMHLVEFWKQK